MPRGKNYVNNHKGMSLQGHQKNRSMEQCFFGDACTRPNCFYRHQNQNPNNADTTTTKSSSSNKTWVEEVCEPEKDLREPCRLALAGLCHATAKTCAKRHVTDPEERQRLLSRMGATPCRFGNHCKTKNCLYKHPTTTTNNNSNGNDSPVPNPQQAPAPLLPPHSNTQQHPQAYPLQQHYKAQPQHFGPAHLAAPWFPPVSSSSSGVPLPLAPPPHSFYPINLMYPPPSSMMDPASYVQHQHNGGVTTPAVLPSDINPTNKHLPSAALNVNAKEFVPLS